MGSISVYLRYLRFLLCDVSVPLCVSVSLWFNFDGAMVR